MQKTQRHVVCCVFLTLTNKRHGVFIVVCDSWRYRTSTYKLSQKVPKMTPKGVLGDLLGGPKNVKKVVFGKNPKITKNYKNQIEKKTIQKPPSSSRDVFKTNLFTKKNDFFLDVIKFNLIANNGNYIIALGGINETNISRLRSTKSIAIASISWIKKNGPNKFGPF